MVEPRFSCTSNVVKLLKHLPNLESIQSGRPAPVMLHVMPTHRCQLDCAHCCFKNRGEAALELDPNVLMDGVAQFGRLGVKAIEFTGGGEPTLYRHLSTCLDFVAGALDMKVGICTNGIDLRRIEILLRYFSWVRVSLNTLDYRPASDIQEGVEAASRVSRVTFAYIWNDRSDETIRTVADVAEQNRIICRVAPDCIQPLKQIDRQMDHIRRKLQRIGSRFLFLSDFNVTLTRANASCYMHNLKPAIYTDGYVYPCPSSELAVEKNKRMSTDLRVCHASQVFNFYTSEGFQQRLEHDCSYCKYSRQNELMEALLTETVDNEFA